MTGPVNNSNAIHFLIELRSRLIYSLIFLFIIFALCTYFANHLYTLLALPLLHHLPQGHLIATQIVSPFFVPFKLAFMASILVSVPFFLYQLWSFIAPALYAHERKLVWLLVILSAVLFYAGLAFAYFIIFPVLFKFLANIAPVGVALTPDISEYLDFTIKLMLTFGLLFEIPIIMAIITSLNLIARARFLALRSYAIVAAFILGMLLAPPDVLSQILVAIPIWLLYEAGILLTYFLQKNSSSIVSEVDDDQKV